MKRKIALLLVLSAATLLPSVQAGAAKGIGLTPAIQEIALDASQPSTSFPLTVTNTTDQPMNLKLSTLDFGSLDDSGGVAFIGQSDQSEHGLSRWMRLEYDQLTLEPGQSDEVLVTIENQDSLAPGGHYGAVVVSAAGTESGSDSVSVLPAASTLVLLKKTGGDTYGLEANITKANSSLLNLPKSVTLSFKNTGNTHVVPRGTVELLSPFGKTIARGSINESSSFVLPDSSRKIDVQLTGYNQPWLPGRYKLEVAWRYDGTDQLQTVVIYKWFIGSLVVYGLGLLCLALVLYLYIRNRRRPPTRN